MMRNRRGRDPAQGHNCAGGHFLISAMASKISSRLSLANAFEILSILELSISAQFMLLRRERTSVVART